MYITVITDKTLIIPEGAPLLLKTELLKAECTWQTIKQENDSFTAFGTADFHIAYLTPETEQAEDIVYEKLLQMLDEAACEPQLPQTRHFLHIKSPLELCGELPQKEKIIGLQLCDLAHKIISPRALEVSLKFSIELQEEIKQAECTEVKITEEAPAEEKEIVCCKELPEQSTEASQPKAETICPSDCSTNPASPNSKIIGYKNENCLPQTETAKEMSHCSSRFRQRMNKNDNCKSSYCMKFYRVREGDSLWSIAEKMQVGAAQISELNHLEDGGISAGMLLAIPR